MKRIDWNLMRPQDIEIRPAQIKDGKATLLLYQNARNTMDALDENFGEFGWKIEYKDVAGQIYGRLSILDPETREWVYKEDTGDESNISAQKGQSSDILKRCAVRFGYGRELYSAPRIVVDDNGYGCSGYKVSKIEYNDSREIIYLEIVDRFGKEVYRYSQATIQPAPAKPQNRPVAEPEDLDWAPEHTKDNLTILRDFCGSLKGKVDNSELKKFFLFYEKRCSTWQGKIDPERLWQRWMETSRKVA